MERDRVQIVLDLGAALLAEAAEEERAMIAGDSEMSSLDHLGCAVLRAAERAQAEAALGKRRARDEEPAWVHSARLRDRLTGRRN